ncbi:MAG TPA: [acyl-carrier-protein] S-malonyltransferase [Deltaproteobacteria bacterium]|nr:[acyl-carrier-protein] S-malonyltransferase [Deltaproteobacteria bacterium]
MGRDAFDASPRARAIFEEADETLGMGLSKLCFEGPEDDLRRTEIQQPAILTTSLALLGALEDEVGPLVPERVDFVGGHSLGEYSALVAAGALRFDEAVRTVRLRGRLMQEAVAEGRGAMAAILGIPADVVQDACARAEEETGLVVTPANFNSPQQTVIAGDAAAVEIACNRARELGAKRTLPLPVSAPFHCSLMEPAARELEPALLELDFQRAAPPVITNVEAKANVEAKRMPELLRRQVTAPVRFTDMIAEMKALGVDAFLEVGPGRVLSGLIARIDRRARRASFSSLEDLDGVRGLVTESEGSD